MIGKWIFKQFMRLQIFMYRRSGGKMLGHLRGMPVLLLTTIGRKSGKRRVAPVMYIRDGNNYVVTASNSGDDKHPGWFLNLRANPQITIEVDGMTKRVTAHQASSQEKGRLWPQLVEKAPFFDGYRKKTRREIPMVILEPSGG
jgi:F420H(2)-dependent quinone reductase